MHQYIKVKMMLTFCSHARTGQLNVSPKVLRSPHWIWIFTCEYPSAPVQLHKGFQLQTAIIMQQENNVCGFMGSNLPNQLQVRSLLERYLRALVGSEPSWVTERVSGESPLRA